MIVIALTMFELSVGAIIFCCIMLVKNDRTYAMHMKILDAILKYRLQCIDQDKPCKVDFDDMESYDETFHRFWDWGYTNILPKEKFEIIKPYIKEEQKRYGI